jgi:hypothetical protein
LASTLKVRACPARVATSSSRAWKAVWALDAPTLTFTVAEACAPVASRAL